LKVLARSESVTVTKQRIGIASFPPLSQGRLLFIRLREKGDSIDLALPSSVKPGKYLMRLRLVTSWDYAVVRASLNGVTLGSPVDTYSPAVAATWVDVGPVEIAEPDNVLRLEAVGRNSASSGFYAGIDALVLATTE
jgi:hypothetical protein